MHVPSDVVEQHVGRGDIPFALMQPPMPGGMGRPRTSPEARAWFWLHDRIMELVAARTSVRAGAIWQVAGLTRRLTCWKPRALQAGDQQQWALALAGISNESVSTLVVWAVFAKHNAESAVA